MGNDYRYKDNPLTVEIAEEILDLQYGKVLNQKKVGEQLLQLHLKQEGLPPENDKNLVEDVLLNRIIRGAFRHLKNKGRAERTENLDVWKVHPKDRRVFGIGDENVYCFYDPRDRNEAERRKERVWTCNIGRTTRSVLTRVREKTNQWTVEPKIDLIFKTSRSKELEGRLHRLLKVLGRHRKDIGREWFDVHPDEVLYLYRLIAKFESYSLANG